MKPIARIALAITATGLAILSFLNFAGAAAFYSAWFGRPGVEAQLARANRRGDFFFLLSLAFELVTAAAIAPFIELSGLGSAGFKVVARYLVALLLSLLATGVLVWLLVIFRVV